MKGSQKMKLGVFLFLFSMFTIIMTCIICLSIGVEAVGYWMYILYLIATSSVIIGLELIQSNKDPED